MNHHWECNGIDATLAPQTTAAISGVLATDGILALPTDTYYALGAAYDRHDALDRVTALKSRDRQQPLLLLAANAAQAFALADGDANVMRLAEHFWPGPLTLVLRARVTLHERLVNDRGGVAMRVPAARCTREVAEAYGGPVTGTSANRRGAPPVASVARLDPTIVGALDGALDAGETPGGEPSTLLDTTCAPFRILRQGAVSRDLLRAVVGSLLL